MPDFPRARRVLTIAIATVITTGALLAPLTGVAAAQASTGGRTSARASGRTAVLADCEHRRVEPHRVFIACGDGALFLQLRSYRSWGPRQAVARGAIWANDCDPNCAEGTFHRTPARIRLFRPVQSAHHGVLFSRAAVRWHHADGKQGRDVYWLDTRTY